MKGEVTTRQRGSGSYTTPWFTARDRYLFCGKGNILTTGHSNRPARYPQCVNHVSDDSNPEQADPATAQMLKKLPFTWLSIDISILCDFIRVSWWYGNRLFFSPKVDFLTSKWQWLPGVVRILTEFCWEGTQCQIKLGLWVSSYLPSPFKPEKKTNSGRAIVPHHTHHLLSFLLLMN